MGRTRKRGLLILPLVEGTRLARQGWVGRSPHFPPSSAGGSAHVPCKHGLTEHTPQPIRLSAPRSRRQTKALGRGSGGPGSSPRRQRMWISGEKLLEWLGPITHSQRAWPSELVCAPGLLLGPRPLGTPAESERRHLHLGKARWGWGSVPAQTGYCLLSPRGAVSVSASRWYRGMAPGAGVCRVGVQLDLSSSKKPRGWGGPRPLWAWRGRAPCSRLSLGPVLPPRSHSPREQPRPGPDSVRPAGAEVLAGAP